MVLALLGLIGSVILFALVSPTMPNVPRYPYGNAVYLLFVLSNATFFYMIGAARPRLASCFFWLFFSYFVFLPGYFQLNYGFYFYVSTEQPRSPDIILSAIGVGLAGSLSVILGHGAFAVMNRKGKERQSRPVLPFSNTTLLTVMFTAFALSYLIALALGFSNFTMSRYDRLVAFDPYVAGGIRNIERQGGSLSVIVGNLPRVCSALGVFLFALYVKREWTTRRRVNPFWLVVGGGVTLATIYILINPLSVARFWFFGVMLVAFMTVVSLTTVWRRFLFFGFFVTASFIVLPLVDIFARRLGSITKFADLGIFQHLRNYLLSGDLNQFVLIMNAVYYVRERGYEDGRQLLSVLLFYVPRAVWAGKGVPTGELTAAVAGYRYLNLSMPIFGEFYVDGGLVLVILLSLALGFAIAWLDERIYRSFLNHDYFTRLWIMTYVGFSLMIYRGALLGIIGNIAFMLLIYTPLYFIFVRRRAAGAAPLPEAGDAAQTAPSGPPPLAARWIARKAGSGGGTLAQAAGGSGHG